MPSADIDDSRPAGQRSDEQADGRGHEGPKRHVVAAGEDYGQDNTGQHGREHVEQLEAPDQVEIVPPVQKQDRNDDVVLPEAAAYPSDGQKQHDRQGRHEGRVDQGHQAEIEVRGPTEPEVGELERRNAVLVLDLKKPLGGHRPPAGDDLDVTPLVGERRGEPASSDQ